MNVVSAAGLGRFMAACAAAAIWFSCAPGALAADSPGAVRLFNLAENVIPGAITSGPGQTIWFAAHEDMGAPTGALWSKRPAIGTIRTDGTGLALYRTGLSAGGQIWDVLQGPDGNVWFTEQQSDGMTWKIGKIKTTAPNQYSVTTYPVDVEAKDLTIGPDGRIWFASADRLGTVIPDPADATAPPTIKRWQLSRPAGSPNPISVASIASGADGKIYLTNAVPAAWVGRVAPTSATSSLQVETASPSGLTGTPYWLARGQDGNIWFTETGTFAFGRLTSAGGRTEYPLVFNPAGTTSLGPIAAGPDGKLWFGGFDAIFSSTTSGAFMQFGGADSTGTTVIGPRILPLWPYAMSPQIAALATGGDSRVWFSDSGARRVGSITPGRNTWNVSVSLTGSGKGTLRVGASGAVCVKATAATKACTVAVAPATSVALAPVANGGSVTGAWGGNCTGTVVGTPCSQPHYQDGDAVTVAFDPAATITGNPTTAVKPSVGASTLKLSVRASVAGKAIVGLEKCATSRCASGSPWGAASSVAITAGTKTYTVGVRALTAGFYRVRFTATNSPSFSFAVS